MYDTVQCEQSSVLSTYKMDGQGQARRRWERCRTPMGTVPLSVIHGFDYPICDSTSGYCFYNLICILFYMETVFHDLFYNCSLSFEL